MNILQVNKFYYPRGGAEQHFLDLTELLQVNGHHVVPFATQDDRNLPSPYAEYFVSGMDLSNPESLGFFKKIKYACRFFYNWEAKRKLKKLLQKERIDIAHLHNIYHHLSPSILPLLKKQGIPVVLTIHDYKLLCPNYTFMNQGKVDEALGRGWYLKCLKDKCVDNSRAYSTLATLEMIWHHKIKKYYERYVDLFIAPSEFVRDLFIKFGWDKNKIIVLPHFLPLSFVKVSEPPATPEKPRFVYIGRMSEEKGIKKLVEFWCRRKIPYELHLFGDGPLSGELREIIAASPNAKVVFHGQVERGQLYEKIRGEVSALILPSIMQETFGLALIEAFGNGIPVIASAVGAYTELINQSGAGILFDWEDEETLVQALQQVQHHDYVAASVAYLKNNFLAENYYRKLLSVYERLLGK